MENEKLFKLMEKMYSEMHEGFKNVNEKIDNLDSKVDKGFSEINTRIDDLSSGIGKMVADEVAGELSIQLKELKTDIKFIKHKLHETEEDVFDIKDHLKIIK